MASNEKAVRLTPGCNRAIAAGRKFQMRSVLKDDGAAPQDRAAPCPLGSPGDLLRTDDGILLRITHTRVERLQEISDRDLSSEGGMWRETASPETAETERQGFARWWDQAHARPGTRWVENPRVWVIDFERTDGT
jgi:hypothetical protein